MKVNGAKFYLGIEWDLYKLKVAIQCEQVVYQQIGI